MVTVGFLSQNFGRWCGPTNATLSFYDKATDELTKQVEQWRCFVSVSVSVGGSVFLLRVFIRSKYSLLLFTQELSFFQPNVNPVSKQCDPKIRFQNLF